MGATLLSAANLWRLYNEVPLSRFEKVPGVGGHRHKVKSKKDSVFDADLDKYKVSLALLRYMVIQLKSCLFVSMSLPLSVFHSLSYYMFRISL